MRILRGSFVWMTLRNVMIAVWFTWCNMKTDPTAREVELGPVHPVQIWMYPIGFFKISETNTLSNPARKLWHLTVLNSPMWKNSLSKCVAIYIYAGLIVQCYRLYCVPKVLILSSWQRRFFTVIHTLCIYVQYVYNRALYTYINVCACIPALVALASSVFMIWLRARTKTMTFALTVSVQADPGGRGV
jgi:hypothetical protein